MGKDNLSGISDVSKLRHSKINVQRLQVVVEEALREQLLEISFKVCQEVARFTNEVVVSGTPHPHGNVSPLRQADPSPQSQATLEPVGLRDRPRPPTLSAREVSAPILSEREVSEPLPLREDRPAVQRRDRRTATEPVSEGSERQRRTSIDWSKRAYKTKTYGQIELEDRLKVPAAGLTWIGTPKWKPSSMLPQTLPVPMTASPWLSPRKSDEAQKPARTPHRSPNVKSDAWELMPGSVQDVEQSPRQQSQDSQNSNIGSLVMKANGRSVHSKLRCTAGSPEETVNRLDQSHSSSGVVELRHLDSSFTVPDEVFERRFSRIVMSECFDYLAGFVVFLSTVYIGVKANYLLQEHKWFMTPFKVIDLSFCMFFVIELSLRVYVFRSVFFNIDGWEWNVMDLVLTVYQVLQEILEAILFANRNNLSQEFLIHRPTPIAMYFRFLRFLRILRLIRVPRLRRYITEFRVMASSVLHSLRYLLWACVILWFFIYVFAVHISLTVGRSGVINPQDLAEGTLLYERWGTLPRAMFSLFQAITGGEDWYLLLSALTEISLFASFVFTLYICFTSLYIMNIITGVFVEVAMTEAQEISEINMISELRDLFSLNDENSDGVLTWGEFQVYLQSPAMKRTFDAIDLDVHEAENLFTLLDMDQSGSISYEEFVTGCLRLRGSAKSIDVATLMYESRRTRSCVTATNALIMRISEALNIQCSLNNSPNNSMEGTLSPIRREVSFNMTPPPPRGPGSPISPVLT